MKRLSPVLIVSLLILSGLNSVGQVRIAVSKTNEKYEAWLRRADPDVVTVNMYGMPPDSARIVLSTCSGLLVTGGEDVYPDNYGKGNEISKCEDFDRYRDSLEFALISKAVLMRMPIFGICRGEQILNVALGGTLITDIPTFTGTRVLHRCPPGSEDCLHNVTIDPNSLLFQITRISKGNVNSYHHQAVDAIAPGMKSAAVSDDGIVEAIEIQDPDGKSLIMGVQWHPESLEQNPDLSLPLAVHFLNQVKEYGKFQRSRGMK
jgi:putative glutamine amidotransferase